MSKKWTVSSVGKNLAIRQADGIPVLLATLENHLPINGIDQNANAALMASAPDLLAACRAVIEWAETSRDHGGNPWCMPHVLAARDAIEKAGVR